MYRAHLSRIFHLSLRTHDNPIFGVIVAFSHSFAQSKYFWAVVEQFTTAKYDNELKMWHVSITATRSSLVMLDHLSYPLVVAIDESQFMVFKCSATCVIIIFIVNYLY